MPPLYLIDGYNFLHAVVLKGRERAGWWSPEHQARVVSRVAALTAGKGADLWVVFDRRGPVEPPGEAGSLGGASESEGQDGVEVHHAPDADDYIVTRCAELRSRREVIVVSADRSLVDRARFHGARGLSPWAFAGADTRLAAGSPTRGGPSDASAEGPQDDNGSDQR